MLQEGDKGVEKRLTLTSKKRVVLEDIKHLTQQKLFNGAKIKNIFTRLGISNHFVGSLRTGNKYLARNAGIDLHRNKQNQHLGKKHIKIEVTDFFPILWGLKILEDEDHYLFDLKPENIGVTKDKEGQTILAIFDTDELCTLKSPIWRITQKYSCIRLINNFIKIAEELKSQPANNKEQTTRKLKIIGSTLIERPMAITMLKELTKYNFYLDKHDKKTEQVNVAQTNRPFIKQFCNEHIKLDYHNDFELLVTNPIEYTNRIIKNKITHTPLLEMFEGSAQFIEKMNLEKQKMEEMRNPKQNTTNYLDQNGFETKHGDDGSQDETKGYDEYKEYKESEIL